MTLTRVLLPAAALLLALTGCTAPPVPTASPTPTPVDLPAGEEHIGSEGACSVLAVIEQGLMAATQLPADQLDATGREAQLELVGIQILQAASVFDGDFRDDFQQLLAAGPGSEFRAQTPTAFDPDAPAFVAARDGFRELCEAAGHRFGGMAVTPGG